MTTDGPITANEFADREFACEVTETLGWETWTDTPSLVSTMRRYYEGSTEVREVIDNTLMDVCGWTLPTLVNRTRRRLAGLPLEGD